MQRVASPRSPANPERGWLERPELAYSLALFAAAATLLIVSGSRGLSEPRPSPWIAVFFLMFGLFCIRMGYQHPGLGYVSFDRLAQVSSLLVVGPFHASWINGLASLLFPLWRFREGASVRQVVTAGLNNAGLMTLMIFGCGWVYVRLGGPILLTRVESRTALLLALLILMMQGANELGLRTHMRLREGLWPERPNLFAMQMEVGSAMAGVLVAIICATFETSVIVLALVILCAGMLVLRQFARMRIRLEAIVEERTRVLHEKTLELQQLATRDQLTGLFNRRFADEHVRGRIEEFQRYGRGFSIALVDLDHFKRVNDELSHGVGDEVLRRVAEVFVERCRESDMVARWGGEEFLICFAEADAKRAAQICDELRREVVSTDWSGIAPGVSMSLSAGVAQIEPGLDFEELLHLADGKLYRAKGAGRNVVLA